MGYGDFSEEKTAKMTRHILPEAGRAPPIFATFLRTFFFVAVRSTYRKIAPTFSAVILGQKIL
jgi:hypothetical protein